MSSPQQDPRADDAAARALVERRAAALGPVLPDQVEAESPGGWGDEADGSVPDEEWLREVPPHHG